MHKSASERGHFRLLMPTPFSPYSNHILHPLDHVSMPTTREKSSRRRNASVSSDSGLPNSLSSPSGHTHPEEIFDPLEMDGEFAGMRLDCNSISLPCCNPRGCILGSIDSSALDAELIRMSCTNDKCPYSSFMHSECFDSFEEQVLSCLRGMSRAKNWSEKQRKQNLWTKKGYDLIYKFCTCRCTRGTLRKDLNHVIPDALPTSLSVSSMVTITSDKGTKKKRKKSASLSEKSSHTIVSIPPPRTRSRSYKNSDSISSDNGTSYMQPFAHRTDYSIFDQLLPRSMVNSYHIKMEDDGYAAGDDTRSFVLSSLAYHHKSHVSCVLCDCELEVYDRYPLLNGTFYLSPIQPKATSLEVESKDDSILFMSAVCVMCLVGVNHVQCSFCRKVWNGRCHQVGTMYSYDLFAATPCCSTSIECNNCKLPVVELTKLSLSFTQLSSQYDCSACGTHDYHFIKPINRFQVFKKPLEYSL